VRLLGCPATWRSRGGCFSGLERKVGDGQLVPAGSIIVRQRGMTFLSGSGTGLGRDYTVFATVTGKVHFEHQTKHKKRIRVEPVSTAAVSPVAVEA